MRYHSSSIELLVDPLKTDIGNFCYFHLVYAKVFYENAECHYKEILYQFIYERYVKEKHLFILTILISKTNCIIQSHYITKYLRNKSSQILKNYLSQYHSVMQMVCGWYWNKRHDWLYQLYTNAVLLKSKSDTESMHAYMLISKDWTNTT